VPPVHVAPLAIALAFLSVCTLRAQRVELAGKTGTLAPPAEWTVLTPAALAANERADDPQPEPARTIVRNLATALRTKGSTADHVLLHSLGKGGELRSINAYHGPVSATVAELRGDNFLAGLRGAFTDSLQSGGAKATFVATEFPTLWPTGSLRLRFAVRAGELEYTIDYHVVPAGTSLQFFEALHFATDADAPAAIDSVLRTFDGAKEPQRTNLLAAALLGACTGGTAGLVVWFLRRRKLTAA
jgi:hypothetical protein